MIAFLLADLRDWRDRRMGRTLARSAVIIFLGGTVGPLHPVLLAMACAAAFILSGWAEGLRYQSEAATKRLILGFPRSPLQIVAGKVLSLLAIWAALAVTFSPPLAASAFAWGTSLPFIAAALAFSLFAFLLSGAIGFFLCLTFKTFERPLGLILLLVWTIPGIYVEWARTMNPFFQILDTSKGGWAFGAIIGMGAELVLTVAFFALSVPVMARTRSRYHA